VAFHNTSQCLAASSYRGRFLSEDQRGELLRGPEGAVSASFVLENQGTNPRNEQLSEFVTERNVYGTLCWTEQ
jgi:hypothetical protein